MIQPKYIDSRDRSFWFQVVSAEDRDWILKIVERIYEIYPDQVESDSRLDGYEIRFENESDSLLKKIDLLYGSPFGIQFYENKIRLTKLYYPIANLWNAYSPYRVYSGDKLMSIDDLLRRLKVTYDFKKCQSLFGYAIETHKKYRGVCQLCGAGYNGITFDLFRQLTVEHIIGKNDGGYLSDIIKSVGEVFPYLSKAEIKGLANKIEFINMVTACQFCNAMTSRYKSHIQMKDLIKKASEKKDISDCLNHIEDVLKVILATKVSDLKDKIESVKNGYMEKFKPNLVS